MIDQDPLNEYLPERDPMVQLTEEAWQRTVKGTWAESDKRIFAEGFRQGWQARLHYATGVSKEDAQEYLRRTNGMK